MAKKQKILVVDDMRTILERTRETLEKFGYEVAVAENWQECISFLPSTDVVLMDYYLATLKGDQITMTIKNRYPNIKVFYYSSESPEKIKQLVRETKADGYIADKGNMAKLLVQLRRLLR
jgi:CheY-like chemotaxis protein